MTTISKLIAEPRYDTLAHAPVSDNDKVLYVATDSGLYQWQGGTLNPVGPQTADVATIQSQVNALGSAITPANGSTGVVQADGGSPPNFVVQGITSANLSTTSNIPTITKGVEASIPSASAVHAGSIYIATDTGATFESDGSSTWTVLTYPNQIIALGNGGLTNVPLWAVTTGGASNIQPTSGTELFVGVTIPKGATFTRIGFRTATTAATLGSNNDSHWYWLIRNQAGALQCSTADGGTGAIAAGTNFFNTIARDSANAAAASWTCPATDTYLVGMMIYLGTGGAPVAPSFVGASALNSATLNGWHSVAKLFAVTGNTAQTTGTPSTSATFTNGTLQPIGVVFPT